MNIEGRASSKTSFLVVTLDSCRWDTFESAQKKQLDSLCKWRKAYSQGTYTLPAHVSIFSGILPNVRENIPYYNRFSRNLFRISAHGVDKAPFVEFPGGTKNIIEGFRSRGYSAFGTGAVMWFRSELLTASFEDFFYSGIHFDKQADYLLANVKRAKPPFFLFVNVGETHEPYEFGGPVFSDELRARTMMRAFRNAGFLGREFKKQIRCVEYLDDKVVGLVYALRRYCEDLVVVICGDHGECFGEDGFYGHGFYHEKVMEVPLGIFRV